MAARASTDGRPRFYRWPPALLPMAARVSSKAPSGG
jgi:hypothetical protein